jgi:hypothetical protein
VESRNDVPLKSEFQPAMKVLSRKPAPSVVSRKNPLTGIERLTIEDEEDDDEEDGGAAKQLTMEERQLKAQKEREEKQRKYEEVRQRLFGTPSAGFSPSASTNNLEPRSSSNRGRGRGWGGREDRSQAPTNPSGRQLYDPNYTVKPDSLFAQRNGGRTPDSGRSTPSEDAVLRKPRGPDGSGRGGFGFSNRGNKLA